MSDNGVKIALIIEELFYDYIRVITFDQKTEKEKKYASSHKQQTPAQHK